MYIVLAILIFGFLIFIHELGHFLTAKLMGVQVNEFAICMGPAIWQRKRGETTYSLRCIPVGGYCAMEGEDEDSDNPRAFGRVAVWRRLLILVAGSFMNFFTGFLIVLILLSSAAGFSTTVIDGFYEGCPMASEDGLQEGDQFYRIDGERVYLYADIPLLLSRNTTGKYDLEIIRGGEKIKLEDFPMAQQTYTVDGKEETLYGFLFRAEENAFGSLVKNAWNNTLYFVQLVRLGLSDLITGAVGLKDMSGPVGIVKVISDTGNASASTSDGIQNVLYLGAFIAVNLAVMNMLPLPALDGGRVVCLLLTAIIETVTRRKLNPKYEGYLHTAGIVLLLGLMVFVTFHDVFMLIAGGSS